MYLTTIEQVIDGWIPVKSGLRTLLRTVRQVLQFIASPFFKLLCTFIQ